MRRPSVQSACAGGAPARYTPAPGPGESGPGPAGRHGGGGSAGGPAAAALARAVAARRAFPALLPGPGARQIAPADSGPRLQCADCQTRL